ncbi:hypothetical protein [Candidatus Leptofilum sp.]|uniref:hypothetical protein n=1 Tax=Candidatus Leptofilum sp. TaxID=3241576 RepID=UPI003B5B4E2C
MSRRWFSWHLLIFAFVIIMLGITSYLYLIPLKAYFLSFIFFSLIAYLLYNSIAGLLNQTKIKIDDFELKIKHGPIPWPGNQTIKHSDFVQISTFPIYNGQRTIGYNLTATLASGERKRLLSNIRESHEALFLEQEMRSYLGLRDKHTVGEYGDKLSPPSSLLEVAQMSDDLQPLSQQSTKRLLHKPKSIKTQKSDGKYSFAWKWKNQSIIKLFMGIIFTIFFFPTFLFSTNSEALASANIFVFFMLLFGLAGIYLTYTAIAGYVNKTTISLDQSNLRVTHEPLPWRNHKLNRDDITQLYTKKVRIKNGVYAYHLIAILAGGKRLKLFSTRDSKIPMFIAQELEAHLDIEDTFVEEEFLWEYKPAVGDFKSLFTYKYRRNSSD